MKKVPDIGTRVEKLIELIKRNRREIEEIRAGKIVFHVKERKIRGFIEKEIE